MVISNVSAPSVLDFVKSVFYAKIRNFVRKIKPPWSETLFRAEKFLVLDRKHQFLRYIAIVTSVGSTSKARVV